MNVFAYLMKKGLILFQINLVQSRKTVFRITDRESPYSIMHKEYRPKFDHSGITELLITVSNNDTN